MQFLKEQEIKEGILVRIYLLNQKYLIKFLRGSMEQTIKVSQMDLAGLVQIEEWLGDEGIQNELHESFNFFESGCNVLKNEIGIEMDSPSN